VDWGRADREARAAETLRRLSAAGGSKDALDRAISEPEILFVAFYDAAGRRVRSATRGLEPPASLPTRRPEQGRTRLEWKTRPSLLVVSLAVSGGFVVAAFDPGRGAALRSFAGRLTVLVPVVGLALVVLAWLYLRSMLKPYERLLAAAGAAPSETAAGKPPGDERDFLMARFESTIAALSEKERELARFARAEKERADDLEIAARTLARNLPTGLLSVDRDGLVIELNESASEILGVPEAVKGQPSASVLSGIPELLDLVAAVLRERGAVNRREIRWRQGDGERVIGVMATPRHGADGRFLGVLAIPTDIRSSGSWRREWLVRHRPTRHVSAGAAHEFRVAAALSSSPTSLCDIPSGPPSI
jgi:PAS domain S-box-containing protein